MDDVEQDAKDLVEKARILSEATGRDLAEVIADLADDGILNESNKKQEKLTRIGKAAELIVLSRHKQSSIGKWGSQWWRKQDRSQG